MSEISTATLSPNSPGLGADQLLDTLPWGLLEVSTTGIIRRLNRQAATWWGLPVEAVLGQALGQVGPGQLPAPAYAALGQAASGHAVAAECYLPQTEQWVTLISAPQPTGDVLVYWQDSTAPKKHAQQYQALAENTPDALARWDTALRLGYANSAFVTQVGRPLPALLGCTPSEMGLPTDLANSYTAALQRVFATNQPQEHFYHLPTPQDLAHYYVRLVPELRDGQVDTVLGIARDVTALRQAEAELREQVHFRTQLAELSPDRILVRELATGQVLYVNRAVLPELGYDPDGRLAAAQRGEVPFPGWPTDEAALAAYWATLAMATDEAAPEIEHRLQALDGTWQWYRMRGQVFARDAQGRPTQALSVTTRLTAEKEAQAAAQQSSDLLQSVFEAVPHSIMVLEAVRDEQGRVVDFHYVLSNGVADRHLGLDLRGRHLRELLPGYLDEENLCLLAETVDTGRPTERTHRYDSGSGPLWLHARYRRLGELVVVSHENITARKQAEQETLRLQHELTQQATDRYLTLFNALDQGFCTIENRYDAHGRALDYRFLEVSASFAQQTGIRNGAGRWMREIAADQDEFWFDTYGRVGKTRQPERFEHFSTPLGRWWSVYAFPIDEPARHHIGVLFDDITARKQQEERQAFLLRLSDALRPLEEPLAIQREASRLLRQQLGAMRVAWGEMRPDAVTCNVLAEDLAEGGFSLFGQVWDWAEFDPDGLAVLNSGQTISREDVQSASDLAPERKATFAAYNFRAFINTPLVKSGRLVAFFLVHFEGPRLLTPGEVALTEETAERTWAAVERAQAEVALRASEERLQVAVDAAELGTFVWHVAEDRTEEDARARVHFGLPPGSTVSLAEALVTTFHPDDAPRYAAGVAQAIDPAGPGTLHEEFRVRHPNGQERWLAVDATAAFAGTPRAVVRLTGVLADITVRKQQEQHQQFLLQLSDRLRRLADPRTVQQAALHWVGEQLGLDRLLFNEIDPAITTYTVRASYVREGFLAYGGQQPMGPFTKSVRALQQGRTKVVYDVETDESFSPEERVICADIRVRAFVVVPLVKGGRWLINLVAHASQPRLWPPHEVALLEETAERTWAAVEQAKAEEALRESEAELRSFVMASSDTLYRMSADWQQMHSLQSKDFMTPTTAPSETWLTRYIPPADQPAVQTAVQAAIAGQHFFELEHRVFRADGSVGWTFSRAVPVLGPQGELVEWFGTASDITARKTAEDAQRRSEERLRLALDAAELGTWDWDIDANEVRWNERHFTMLGLEPRPGLLTPDDFARTIHPDDRPDVLRRLQAAVAESHLFEAEFRILTPQQEVRWMSGHGQASDVAPEGRVRRMSGVLLDVTERKHAEQHLQALAASLERKVARRTRELQASRDLLQSVFDTNLIAMAVMKAVRDDAGQVQDFRIILVNKELERETGRADLVGQHYVREYPGAREAGLFDRMLRVLTTGEPQSLEYHYGYEGFNRWYASQFVKLDDGVVATNLDITERKTTEQQLTRNLHLLEQAETVAQLGSWDYDLASGQFYWSGGMYGLFGLPLGQPIQPPIYLDYVLAEDRPQAEQLVRQITTGAGDFETTLRLQVGEAVKTVRIKAVVLRDAAGQAVRVLGVDLDLSELQRLEADNLRLRLSQQQALFEAVQAAEEEERRRMSESLHNGIGQILYATKLQLDCLPDAPELSPRRKAADLLSEAIRQTRALSHELTPAILEQYGLEKTLQSICSTLNTPGLRWRCHLEFGEAPPLPMSLQLAVYRLAQELAQNVLKHAQATEATLEVDVLPAWVVLRVEDNGQGFDPAQTSDGLGLRSLRSRAALLGGSVHLTTAPGQGMQCQIRIPLPSLS